MAAITGSPNPLAGLNFPGASALPLGNIVADSQLVLSVDHGNQQAHADQKETNNKLERVVAAIDSMSSEIADLANVVDQG